jgi:transposase-like protein
MAIKKISCPRCASSRFIERLDGSKTCRRCGQKWLGKKVIASQDKRKPSKVLPGRSLAKPGKKKQLSLF